MGMGECDLVLFANKRGESQAVQPSSEDLMIVGLGVFLVFTLPVAFFALQELLE
jgi:hypothetical protein